MRSELLQQGISINMGYVGEMATSVHGGYRKNEHATRYADQFTLGTDIDLQKLAGWDATRFSFTLTNRNGDDLGDRIDDPRATGFGSSQEVHGRGSVTRISELWLSKGWANDLVNLKVGRFAVGDDFAAEDCTFQNLAFCGSQPGNYVDSIYNGPVSQWAARIRYRIDPSLYVQIGAFNVNPSNLENDNGLKLNGAGTTGTLTPLELVWQPRLNNLPGEYQVGYYHSTVDAADVLKDEYGLPAARTGDPYRAHTSRHGFWMVGKQQLTSVNGATTRGLSVVASATFQDRATTPVDSYQKVSLVYSGPFDVRPRDELGFGIARVHASSRFLKNAKIANVERDLDYADPKYTPEQHTMYVAELNYKIRITNWLSVLPNLQYIKNPDGVRQVSDALVFGTKIQSTF